MVELSETRYVRIEGSSVALEVSTDEEARLALKELRHKKREFRLIKRKISSQLKKSKRGARARTGKAVSRRRARRPHPAYASPLAFVSHSLAAVVGLLNGKPQVEHPEHRDPEAYLALVEETLLHLEEAILHVQGKLI